MRNGVSLNETWLRFEESLFRPIMQWIRPFLDGDAMQIAVSNMSVLTIIVMVFLMWKWGIRILRVFVELLSVAVEAMDELRLRLKDFMKDWIDRL